MHYEFKKGIIFRNGEKHYSYAISEGKMPSFVGGLSLNIEESEDLEEFVSRLEVSDDLEYLTLSNLSQDAFNKILWRIGTRLHELVIDSLKENPSMFDLRFINQCNNLKRLKINILNGILILWNSKKTTKLRDLEIVNAKGLLNQESLNGLRVKKLIIRRHSHGCSNIKGLTIKDFNVFTTMPYLRELILLIGNKKDKVSDLLALSKLSKLKYIELPKNYFFFNQYAWLTSKLPSTRGLGCYKVEYDHANEMDGYIINGSRMCWDVKGFEKDKLNKYIKRFDKLVEKYSNDEYPPIK